MTMTDGPVVAPATRTLLAHGTDVFVRVWDGRRTPALILHGWGSRGERWLPVAEGLAARGHAVALPDFPGFGASPPPPAPWRVEDYACAIDEVVRALGMRESLVVAHSFGARIAVRLAATGRAGIRAMLLTGAAGLRPRLTWRRRLLSRSARAGAAIFALPPLRPAGDLARRALYRALGSMDYYLARGVMRETFKLVIEEDLADDMKAVGVPVYLLWGADDRSTPPEDGRRMAALMPSAVLEVVNGLGHALPHERPDLVAARAEELFARSGGAGR